VAARAVSCPAYTVCYCRIGPFAKALISEGDARTHRTPKALPPRREARNLLQMPATDLGAGVALAEALVAECPLVLESAAEWNLA
jgi:hypothetical protein